MGKLSFWSKLDEIGSAGQVAKKLLKVTKKNAPKRVGTTGQYVGAPEGVNTPRKLENLRAKYFLEMHQGAVGRDWYHDSSDAIRRVANDPELAARAFGRTSQGAAVDTNTGWGIKAYNQSQLGVDIESGRFPQGVRRDLDEFMLSRVPGQNEPYGGFGPKLEPYTQNLRVGWDEAVGERPVHDIWDGRAWGYKNKDGSPWDSGFSDAQHRFMDEQAEIVTRAANEAQLGGADDWDHLRSQAAAWTGAKISHGDISAADAAKGYDSYLDKYTTLLTRETVPGSNTNHLQGMLRNDELKRVYDDEVRKILYAEGKDPIAREFGLMERGQSRGVGVYEGESSPATVVGVLSGRAPTDVGGKQIQMIDPASRELLDASESTYGLLTGQKAYAYNQPVYQNVTKSMSNMADFDIGRALNKGEMRDIARRTSDVFGDSVGVTLTPKGVRFLNFGEPGKGFVEGIGRILEPSPLDGKVRLGLFDSNYVENPWDTKAGRYGQNYLRNIDRPERPNLQRAFDSVAPRLAERLDDLDIRFSREFGLETSKFISQMRRAIASEGLEGLNKLVKTGVVPAAMVASLLGVTTEDVQAAGISTVGRAVSLANRADDAIQPLVRNAPTSTLRTGLNRVDKPGDAAHIASQLRKSAQEEMMAIVADADGNVIDVLRHTRGSTNAAGVDPATLAGSVLDVPDAKSVWFVHNHPSGHTGQSGADIAITRRLNDLMDGTGVKSEGMVVVAPGGKKASWLDDTLVQRDIDVTPAPRRLEQSVSERTFRALPKNLQPITNQSTASKFADELGSGVLFLNNRNMPVGFVPMDAGDMSKLRGGMQADILKEAHKRNANQAFIFGSEDDGAALINTGNLLNTAGIKPLDVISGGKSWRDVVGESAMFDGAGGWLGGNSWAGVAPAGMVAAAYTQPGEPDEHDHLNFVQRYLNPSIYPQIDNGDGTVSTHRMSSAGVEIDGREANIVFPEIIQKPDGSLHQFDDWRDAADYAVRSGEYIEFDTPQEAGQFALNYKDRWGEMEAGEGDQAYQMVREGIDPRLLDFQDRRKSRNIYWQAAKDVVQGGLSLADIISRDLGGSFIELVGDGMNPLKIRLPEEQFLPVSKAISNIERQAYLPQDNPILEGVGSAAETVMPAVDAVGDAMNQIPSGTILPVDAYRWWRDLDENDPEQRRHKRIWGNAFNVGM